MKCHIKTAMGAAAIAVSAFEVAVKPVPILRSNL
jgi:hypothetical protein